MCESGEIRTVSVRPADLELRNLFVAQNKKRTYWSKQPMHATGLTI